VGRPLAKQINCDCGFMLRTNTDEELVRHAQLHAREIHATELSTEQALAMAKPVEAVVDA
jgi:predicted small metal-binding protein